MKSSVTLTVEEKNKIEGESTTQNLHTIQLRLLLKAIENNKQQHKPQIKTFLKPKLEASSLTDYTCIFSGGLCFGLML